MTEVYSIQKVTVEVSGLSYDVFIKPDGTRKHSLSSLTGAIGKPAESARQLPKSALEPKTLKALSGKEKSASLNQNDQNDLKALPGKEKSALGTPEPKTLKALSGKEKSASLNQNDQNPIPGIEQVRYGKYKTLVNLVPEEFSIAYLTYWSNKGNTKAQALLGASLIECINRRVDNALDIKKTEEVYEEQTKQVRLHLVKKFAETYELNQTSFYKSLEAGEFTEEEKDYSLNLVSLKRLYKFMDNQDYLCYRDSEGRRLDTLSDIEDLESRLANL
jgi:hypothetical protein